MKIAGLGVVLRKIEKFVTKRDLQYFLLFLLALALFTKTTIGPWNDRSRIATVESLVERGTFIIDNSIYSWTGDKIYVNGHFYSDKPPVLSFLAAGPYFLMSKLGLTFYNNEGVVYYLLTLICVGIPAALTVHFFHKSLKLVRVRRDIDQKLTIAFGFCTLFLPWSTTFNNHVPATALCFISFYFLLKNRIQASWKTTFLAGFLAALGATIDIVAGSLFFVAFLICLVWNRSKMSNVAAFLVGGLLPFLLHCALNIQITGGILPAQFVPEYFEYPGSPWSRENLSGYLSHPNLQSLLNYAAHSLFGSSGFFSYNPVLLFYFPALPLALRRLRKEGVMILLVTAIVLGFYILKTDNYGGWSYSIRWWIPLIPFFLFFSSFYWERQKSLRIFYVALVVSLVISAIGIINPWTNMGLGPVPVVNNIRSLLAGDTPHTLIL